jgi:SAM-dependent methyltransferase
MPTCNTHKYFQPNKRQPLIYDCQALQQWLLYHPVGREILRKERIFLTHNVQHVFGNYSLQIGLSNINFLHGNKIQNHYTVNVDVAADLRFLPFESNSIDLIVVPHVLEFTNNYHYVLQEFYRILAPHGRIIITCFNKYSWFGLFSRKIPLLKNASLISLTSLKDQVQALNFAIIGGKFFNYCPPFSKARHLRRYNWLNKVGDRWFPTLANSFALILRKEVVTPNLIKAKDLATYDEVNPNLGTASLCNRN